MSWLYACTIYPLQLFYKYVYLACVRVTGSYGIGLIGLSLCCAVAFVPLGRMALNAKKREDLLQDIMQPQLDRIKDESTGAARQERIAKLYRRYGYHPLMSLRSAIGVLLQFPFLTAAYRMVQELTVLKGQPFWFITDLSVPDGLWNGVNALPIVMTLINFATVATAPNMRGKERVQAIVLALLFLWLLYDAPSALLVYWTCNNLNYLAQNFVFRDKKSVKETSRSFHLFSDREMVLGQNGRRILNGVFFILLTLTVAFFVLEFRETFEALFAKPSTKTAAKRLYRIAIITGVFPMLFSLRKLLENRFTLSEAVFKGICLVGGLGGLALYVRYQLIPLDVVNINSGVFMLFLWGIAAYSLFCVFTSTPFSSVRRFLWTSFDGCQQAIFMSSALFTVLLVFVFCESALYYSDPAFFHVSLGRMLVSLVPYALGTAAVLFIIWRLLPRGGKWLLSAAVLLFAVFFFLNAFVFPGNYGALDGNILSKPESLYGSSNICKDIGVILLSCILVWCIFRLRLCRLVAKALETACVCILLFAGFVIVSTKTAETPVSVEEQSPLPPYHDRLWGFSRDGKNVVVFFWDMFTGGHMQEILSRNPGLKKQLSGFVWYPDTTAVGENTFISSPSLLGGSKYTPARLNKDEKTSNIEKMYQAYSTLPNAFTKAGYDVVIAGMPYADPVLLQKRLSNNNVLILKEAAWGSDYVRYWRNQYRPKQALENGNLSKFAFFVSLFKVAPSSLRAGLYDDGTWQGAFEEVAKMAATGELGNLAPMQLMPQFTNANAQGDTFKVIYSMLSHYSWHLPEDALIPVRDPYPQTAGQLVIVDGMIPEHFYSEQHMVRFLAQFCEKLKREHIYDNTRIIVVSDHDEADSNMLNLALGGNWSGYVRWDQSNCKYPGRVHALMLFKDFSADGDIRIDPALVSTEDTPALACMDLFKIDDIPSRKELEAIQNDPGRIREHFIGEWEIHKHPNNRFVYSSASVTGSIFKRENWRMPNIPEKATPEK